MRENDWYEVVSEAEARGIPRGAIGPLLSVILRQEAPQMTQSDREDAAERFLKECREY